MTKIDDNNSNNLDATDSLNNNIMEIKKSNINVHGMRARILTYHQIRQFFIKRNALEVDTPILSKKYIITNNFKQITIVDDNEIYYLQNASDSNLIQLINSGYPDIYQIIKSFNNTSSNESKQIETTLLKWLRVDCSLKQIMLETVDLLTSLSNKFKNIEFQYFDYYELFKNIGINAYDDSVINIFDKIESLINKGNDVENSSLSNKDLLNEFNYIKTNFANNKDVYLHWIFSNFLKDSFSEKQFVFLYNVPLLQVDLSNIKNQIEDAKDLNNEQMDYINDNSSSTTINRFELYFSGTKMAEGYEGVNNSFSQASQFSSANINLDNILMFMLNKKNVADVLAFPLAKL